MAETMTACGRCKRPLKVGPPPNPEARLLKRSTVPEGFCANCAATAFLKGMPPLTGLLERMGPQALSNPMIQAQFAQVLRSGFADAKPVELDWEVIVATWDLPMPRRRARSGGKEQ